MKFAKLFEPIKIRQLEIKNRISNSAMISNLHNTKGEITQRHIDYMEARAKGGFGLLLTEGSYPDPVKGRDFWGQMGCYDDRLIPQMRKLTDTIHQYGTKIFLQIMVVGRQGDNRLIDAPLDLVSDIPCPLFSVFRGPMYKGQVMSIDRIHEVIDQYAGAALRAKEAGFDGVEVHAGHGYLIQQFLSLLSNSRRDEYGCETFENRARFGVEVMEAVKDAVGDDFVVGMKIVGDEFLEGGLVLDDMKEFAKMFEKAGADYFTVSCGTYASFMPIVPYMHFPLGNLEPYAAAIKKVVKIPIMAINRINDPVVANGILERGSADMVQTGRASLSDPEWPNKAKEGREEEIFHCIACLQLCGPRMYSDSPVQCSVNPALGRERADNELMAKKITKKKRVMIIGGGPAGLRCAYDAGRRGHEVTLYDKNQELGGNLRLAAMIPQREGFADVARDLSLHLKKLENVKINLGQQVDLATVKRENPDAVVLATGSKFLIPSDIPGLNKSNGDLVDHVLTIPQLFDGKKKAGKTVIVMGGNSIGLEVAIYLADQGKEVTIVEKRPDLSMVQDIHTFYVQPWVVDDVKKRGIKILTGMAVKEIRDGQVILDQAGGMPPYWDDYPFLTEVIGKQQILPADTIVLALGRLPVDDLEDAIKGVVKEFYKIGDCIGTDPRWYATAVRQGYRVGMLL
jgi:2,4-dienoyl-CoA reductase-like NADH-dependent reductase (Old Yellow Enzyme family)/thioredoxin reductase